MPKLLEKKLEREVEKKHMNKRRENAYVYGTLRRIELLGSKKKERKK